MKNVRSAYVFDLKLLKEFYLVFGIYYKTQKKKNKQIKTSKQFNLFYLVFNSYSSTLIK